MQQTFFRLLRGNFFCKIYIKIALFLIILLYYSIKSRIKNFSKFFYFELLMRNFFDKNFIKNDIPEKGKATPKAFYKF